MSYLTRPHRVILPKNLTTVYTSLIILGGQTPSIELVERYAAKADLTIAADSGLQSFVRAGIRADIAIGDFDSFDGDPTPHVSQVFHAPEQDATDFQKALRHLPKQDGPDNLIILGGTGLRADHFLTNLLIVAEIWPERRINFHDDKQSIYRVTPQIPLEIEGLEHEQTISLIPFCEASGVTTHGLHWPLKNASMTPAGQLGQSNRMDTDYLKISIQSGVLYVVINHAY